MSPPAEVPDLRLQLVERRPDVAVLPVGHGQGRDHVGRDRPDDDVRLVGFRGAHLDPDVERCQAPVDLAPFLLQLGPSPLEGRPEVRATRYQPADLGQADAHVAQRDDPAKVGELGRRVIAVVGRRIDPDRSEQAERVVRAKDLG